MSIITKLLGGGDIVRAVGDSLDNLITSDEERLEKQLELTKAEREYDYREGKLIADQNIAQTKINVEEARSDRIFVAGWRPAIGWIGVFALFYQFVAYPILLWFPMTGYPAPEPMDSDVLFTMITGMLGIAGMRSYDKMKGKNTQIIGMKKSQ